MKSAILLSFVVPFIKPSLFLERLFKSLNSIIAFEPEAFELILINQSGASVFTDALILNFEVKERILPCAIPAYQARNLGAEISSGKYIFFLDDDSFIYSDFSGLKQLLNIIKSINMPTLILAQRGEISDDSYVSHWPRNKIINKMNFSRFIIEWNIIIDKKLFTQLNGFDALGPGSPHLAQCGEAFLLMARLLSQKVNIVLIPEIQVAHPSLFETKKSTSQILGYAYGNGFSVGKSLYYFDTWHKIYWSLRMILSLLYEPIRRKTLMADGGLIGLRYKFLIVKMKLLGFLDGFQQHPPRSNCRVSARKMGL